MRISQRGYFDILMQLQDLTVDSYREFALTLEAMHGVEQAEFIECVQRLNTVEVHERKTFALIYRTLSRN